MGLRRFIAPIALHVPLIRGYAEEKWRLARALAEAEGARDTALAAIEQHRLVAVTLTAERDDLLRQLREITDKHKLAISIAEVSLTRAIIENDRLRDKLPKAGRVAQPVENN